MICASTSTWEVVAALGAAVGGLGAAVGAIAAWRAAAASERTSREARDALVHAIAPNADMVILPLGEPEAPIVTVRVVNMSRWPAHDLELRVALADGDVIAEKRAHLDSFAQHEDDWWVTVRQITQDWPPREAPERVEAVLAYSDSRDAGRYELTLAADVRGIDGPEGSRPTAQVAPEPLLRRRLR